MTFIDLNNTPALKRFAELKINKQKLTVVKVSPEDGTIELQVKKTTVTVPVTAEVAATVQTGDALTLKKGVLVPYQSASNGKPVADQHPSATFTLRF